MVAFRPKVPASMIRLSAHVPYLAEGGRSNHQRGRCSWTWRFAGRSSRLRLLDLSEGAILPIHKSTLKEHYGIGF